MKSRQPIPPESLTPEVQRLHLQLADSSDIAAIVVGVGYLDACLASLLSKRLLKSSVSEKILDPRSGALGSFAARTDMSYVLALIDKSIYQDLKVLGELRNEIAHSHFELGFSDASIQEHCQKLVFIAGIRDSVTSQLIFQPQKLDDFRQRFLLTTSIIANILVLTALGEVHASRSA